MKKIIFGLIYLMICKNVIAGTVTAQVSYIQVNYGTSLPGLVAIKFSAMPTARPNCATDQEGRFGFSLESDAGRALYSMALAAQASGKTLEVYGKNSCVGGSVEELEYMRIKS